MAIAEFPKWHEQASCSGNKDWDMWFYEHSNDNSQRTYSALKTAQSIVICNGCPVKELCLKDGLKRENLEDFIDAGNVWGGLMTSERLALLPYQGAYRQRRIRHEARFRKEVRDLVKELQGETERVLRTKSKTREA